MFGPFHASRVNLGGLLWYISLYSGVLCSAHLGLYRKTPWKMSVTRKANQRKRLKMVDEVIETVRASGVKCAALVCQAYFFKLKLCLMGDLARVGQSSRVTEGT